ncbi:MAG: nicotinate-nucleotide diphosphorylase (carboxylating) [Chloroflexi bacterium HGW-Chloroflexi-4]|nr:MAG: nicotinate-nucleotide diphosphorylase (carboxylating) [Chloroflexi bacterium HGW-Chloroflexi-4]
MQRTIEQALAEDIGSGDVTANTIIPVNEQLKGHIIAKQDGIISGLFVAQAVYKAVDVGIECRPTVEEGQQVTKGQEIMLLTGSARSLLTAERTALNFMGRMSGISTLTRRYVDAVKGTGVKILDTRKTVPGLREFDKLAVKLGGGTNHRIGLYDMILIKDNHIDFAGSIDKAVQLARAASTNLEIEVEARSLADVACALDLGVERILLDNMSAETMHEAVTLNQGRAKLEASGNITLDNVLSAAQTGVDFISIGALTHSVVVFDVSFDYLEKPGRQV